MESFYMTMISNASTDLYSQNSLVSFKNELPKTINVEGLKIALQEIHIDNKFGNIPNAVLAAKKQFLLFLKGEDGQWETLPFATCDISDFFMSIQKLAAFLNEKLNTRSTTNAYRFRAMVSDSKTKLHIILTNATLLVHVDVQGWMNINFHPQTLTQTYDGNTYVILSSDNQRNFMSTAICGAGDKILPKMIKVQLEEMQQNLSGVNLVQDLALFPVSQKQYPIDIVCKRKEYFDFNCSNLTQLTARLVDENNHPLHLGNGQPTFLKLQCKRFAMKSFVLRLSSLESNSVFSNNKTNNFKIRLQETFDINSWDVALASIYLPTNINISRLLNRDNFYLEIKQAGSDTVRISLHELKDFTAEGFVNHANKKLVEAFANPRPILKFIEEESTGNKISIRLTENVELKFSGLLAYLIHYATRATSPTEAVAVNTRIDETLYLGTLNFQRLHPHLIFLYCNFITPVVIGNTYGQVLQMIPFYNSKENGAELMKFEAQHLDFLPMTMNDPTTLHFEMIDHSGEHVQFENNNQEVLLTLVFRKKL